MNCSECALDLEILDYMDRDLEMGSRFLSQTLSAQYDSGASFGE